MWSEKWLSFIVFQLILTASLRAKCTLLHLLIILSNIFIKGLSSKEPKNAGARARNGKAGYKTI